MNRSLNADPGLPGLERMMRPEGMADLSRALETSTQGEWSVTDSRLVRYRHRPGKRAVLQVEVCLSGPMGDLTLPASIWLHAGGKSAKILQRSKLPPQSHHRPPARILEPRTSALLQFFPYDHRVPQIARFVGGHKRMAPQLLSKYAKPNGAPELARFRPGLGATFRWKRKECSDVYVKVFDGDVATPIVDESTPFSSLPTARQFALPRLVGRCPAISAVAFEAAAGVSFDKILIGSTKCEVRRASRKAVRALSQFHRQVPQPTKHKDHHEMVRRAKRAADIVSSASHEQGSRAAEISRWVERTARSTDVAPAHMDMKTEHLVVSDRSVTILDLDSMAMGDQAYDIVMLEARIADLASTGRCSRQQAEAAISEISQSMDTEAPERLRWLRAVCALQIARHHAQSGHHDWGRRLARSLDQWKVW